LSWRRLAIGLTVSCTLWALVAATFRDHPSAALFGDSSDHFSHYSSAILGYYRGLELYRRPVEEICPLARSGDPSRAEETYGGFYREACNIPERAGRRPLVINWHDHIRPYPPGAMLYALPEAFLYQHTDLSFTTINQVSVIKFLLCSHLLIGLLLWIFLGEASHTKGECILALCVQALIYLELVRWALVGFFDALSVLFVVLSLRAIQNTAPARGLLHISLAVLTHFRALWYLPLVPYTLTMAFRQRATQSAADWARLFTGLLSLGVAGWTFALALPHLAKFPQWNPIYWSRAELSLSENALFYLPLLLLLGLIAFKRRWDLLVLIAWQVLMLANTPQTQTWHSMFLLPLLVVGRFRDQGALGLGVASGLAIYLLESFAVFRHYPLVGWLLWLLPGTGRS
jgi:hypothetical protein